MGPPIVPEEEKKKAPLLKSSRAQEAPVRGGGSGEYYTYLLEGIGEEVAAKLSVDKSKLTMWDFFNEYYVPFGELLADMEAEGVAVDCAHLREAKVKAEEDQKVNEEKFKEWAVAKVRTLWFGTCESEPA